MRDEERFVRDFDWNLLKSFHYIARSGGITAASRHLARNQPSVSLSLKRLEGWLGARLCRRGPAGFALLDEGELVAESCSEMAQLVKNIPLQLADLAPHIRGTLRLNMVTDIVHEPLDRALRRFSASYPDVQLRIDVATEESVVRAVQRNDADIGISSNRVRIADLEFRLLFREIHQAFCGRDFHLFGQTVDDLAAYADEPVILGGVDEPEDLKNYRTKTGLGRNAVAISDNLSEQRRLAILSLGICFLPDKCAANDVAAGRLWPLTPTCTDWGIDIYTITNRKAPRHLLQRLFLQELDNETAAHNH